MPQFSNHEAFFIDSVVSVKTVDSAKLSPKGEDSSNVFLMFVLSSSRWLHYI
jgi:hypothetical protein